MKTRNSTTAEGPRDALCQLKFCQHWTTVRKITLDQACNR